MVYVNVILLLITYCFAENHPIENYVSDLSIIGMLKGVDHQYIQDVDEGLTYRIIHPYANEWLKTFR